MSDDLKTTLSESKLGELAGKYLTFKLDEQDYGFEIVKVREIIGMIEVTKVPQTMDFVLGVVNLRGKVIPVVDLRMRFSLEYREPDERTCVVVVEVVTVTGSELLIGAVVDEVNEVLMIEPEDLEQTPRFGSDLDTEYILAMAKKGDEVKILLDIDKILGDGSLVSGF